MITETYNVEALLAQRLEFSDQKSKRGSRRNLARFLVIFPVFMEAAKDKKVFTDEELEQFEYCDYLKTRLHPKHRNPITRWGRRHVFSIMRDGVSLYHDIKDYGLKNPLELYTTIEGRRRMSRGGRRLVIISMLGHKTVPVRIFESRTAMLNSGLDYSWKTGIIDNKEV